MAAAAALARWWTRLQGWTRISTLLFVVLTLLFWYAFAFVALQIVALVRTGKLGLSEDLSPAVESTAVQAIVLVVSLAGALASAFRFVFPPDDLSASSSQENRDAPPAGTGASVS
jgi:hypothetical protein